MKYNIAVQLILVLNILLVGCADIEKKNFVQYVTHNNYRKVDSLLTLYPELTCKKKMVGYEYPLDYAVKRSSLNMVKLLHNRGAKFDYSKNFLLPWSNANQNGLYNRISVLKYLTENVIDPDSIGAYQIDVIDDLVEQNEKASLIQLFFDGGGGLSIDDSVGSKVLENKFKYLVTKHNLSFDSEVENLIDALGVFLYNDISIHGIDDCLTQDNFTKLELSNRIDKNIVGYLSYLYFNYYTLWFDAVKNKNYEYVKSLIKSGVNVNFTHRGLTAMDMAREMANDTLIRILEPAYKIHDVSIIDKVKSKDLEGVENALKNGISVNTRDQNNLTSLIWACKNNDLDMARLLIANNAKVNSGNIVNRKPLSYAICNGNAELVDLLLSKGAEVNYFDRGLRLCPFMESCKYGNIDIVKSIYNKGAFLHSINDQDKSPLYYAVAYNNIEVVKFLLDEEVCLNVPCNDTYLIEIAVQEGLDDMCNLLLEYGVGIDYEFKSGNILEEALEMGMDSVYIDFRDKLVNDSLFIAALQNSDYSNALLMLNEGYIINSYCKDMQTPLMWSVASDDMDAFNFLIQQGADIFKTTNKGNSILMEACVLMRKDMVQELLNKGALVNLQNKENGDTPLMLLCENYLSIYKSMDMDRLQKVDALRTLGDIVEILLKKGADPTVVNEEGMSVKDLYLPDIAVNLFKRYDYKLAYN